jgi:hypothetical protein
MKHAHGAYTLSMQHDSDAAIEPTRIFDVFLQFVIFHELGTNLGHQQIEKAMNNLEV